MARPGFTKHPKFQRLVHLLELPPPYVRGLCETLWDVAYEAGDPIIGDALDVKFATGYPGEPEKILQALLDCGGPRRAGLIENVDGSDGVYQIHDLFDHCPDYVRKRQKREAERVAKSAGERSAKNGGQSPDGDRSAADKSDQPDGVVRTPAPAPAPAPAPKSVASATVRTATSPATTTVPVVLVFPCQGKVREWHLTQAIVDELAEAYPGLDVLAECRKARQWCLADAKRQKSAGGVQRFLVNWLNRSADGGRGHQHSTQHGIAGTTRPPRPGVVAPLEIIPPGPDDDAQPVSSSNGHAA
jgi:hypothetical protein